MNPLGVYVPEGHSSASAMVAHLNDPYYVRAVRARARALCRTETEFWYCAAAVYRAMDDIARLAGTLSASALADTQPLTIHVYLCACGYDSAALALAEFAQSFAVELVVHRDSEASRAGTSHTCECHAA